MDNRDEYTAIILAAGYSRRMKRFKPLLPLGDSIVIEKTITSFKKAGVENILVVLGYKAYLLERYLKKLKVKYIINEDYYKGMFSSIKVGVENLSKETQGFFIIPVDIPLVKKYTIEKMQSTYEDTKASVVCPSFKGKTGHPVLISATKKDFILSYENPERGLSTVLNNFKKDTIKVEVCDRGILYDLDNLEEYEKVKKYYDSMDIPDEEEIEAIFYLEKTDERVINHGKKVASVACDIGEKLKLKGYNLDLNIIRAASLLHDIGKGEKNHAKLGGKIVTKYGYEKLGNIIGSHMDINLNIELEKDLDKYINEKNIVYLADKLVKEEKIIKLEDRFYESIKRYSDNKEIINNVLIKYSNAKILERKIEEELNEKLVKYEHFN